jgi:hypothetical protein
VNAAFRRLLPLAIAWTATGAQQPAAFRLVREVTVDASANDLSPIGWVAVGTDGPIAISQPQDHHVRFFSARGEPLGVFGREGRGPGEFNSMTLHGWIGDTLWVGDLDTRLVILISPRRTLIRSQAWPPGIRFREGSVGPLPSFIFAVPWGLYPDGTVLSFAYLAGDRLPEWMTRPPRSFQPFIRINRDGLYDRVVAWIGEPNQNCYFNAPKGSVSMPLCFQPLWSVSRAGGMVVIVTLERSDGQSDFVRTVAVKADGDTLFSRLLQVSRVRVPRAVADTVRRRLETSLAKSAPGAVVDVPVSETFPPFAQAIVARDEKSVWLESGITTGDRVWRVLDVAGRSIASVRVPRSVELKVVSMDRVWATERDADGLQSVVVYRVVR